MALQSNTGHTVMRELNTSLTFKCLHRDAPLSRSAFAKKTGLNKATVTGLIKELLKSSFVKEIDQANGELGRFSIPIILNPEAGSIVGPEIGVDCFSVILKKFSADILCRQKMSIAPKRCQIVILDRIKNILDDAFAHAKSLGLQILGLGEAYRAWLKYPAVSSCLRLL
jgi:N-acetylglucosamine repressor